MISVYRQADNLTEPATWDSPRGARIAVWQGQTAATRWLHDLVSAREAVDLGGNGYPSRMSARAGAVLPVVSIGPPEANETWISGPHDILTPAWAGKTVVNAEVAQACSDDEWLIIEIWDES